MHAIYAFLLDCPIDPNNDLNSVISDEFFNGYAYLLEENNWWDHVAYVNMNGRIEQLNGSRYWHFLPALEELDQEKRFDAAVREACLLAMEDLDVFNTFHPDRIRTQEELAAAHLKMETAEKRFTLNDCLKVLDRSVNIRMNNESIPFNTKQHRLHYLNSSFKPFTKSLTSPYEYRCFDLTGLGLTEDRGILFTDIHT